MSAGNSMSAGKGEASPEATDPEVVRLRAGIEQTRADMSATIQALETRLGPDEVRDKVGAELKHVEERVRSVVHEQLTEAKAIVQAELLEAKQILRSEMNEAEQKVKKGLAEARDTVKQDVKEAFAGAKHAVRAATLGKAEDLATKVGDKMNDTRDTFVETVRANPIPATLFGVGLVWLLMNRSKSASNRGRGASSGRGGARAAAGQVVNRVGGAVGSAGSAVSDAAHQLSDAANTGLHKATEFAGQAAHSASEATMALAHRAGDAASDAASSVADGARKGARRVEESFQSTLEGNPMALGAAALAVGALVGFSLPRTSGEDALMGDARDRILHRAGDVVHDAASSLAHLAEQGAEGAKKTLEEQSAR